MSATVNNVEGRSPGGQPLLVDRAGAAVARLVVSVFLALAMAAVVITAFLLLARRPTWWAGFLPALVASLLAALVSLPILAWGLHGTIWRAIGGYFAGIVLRMIAGIAASLVAVSVGHFPPVPTLVLLMPFYAAQLVAESIVLMRILQPRT